MSDNANTDNASTQELDTLRDLIFGNQARDFSRRLSELELHLKENTNTLRTSLDKTEKTLSGDTFDQVTNLRQELTTTMDQQQSELSIRIDDLQTHVQVSQLELFNRLNGMLAEQKKQMEAIQAETNRQLTELRQEMVDLVEGLEDKKTSRAHLADLLADLSQRLHGIDENEDADEPDNDTSDE